MGHDEERAREYRISTLEHRSNLVNKDFDLAVGVQWELEPPILNAEAVGLAQNPGRVDRQIQGSPRVDAGVPGSAAASPSDGSRI